MERKIQNYVGYFFIAVYFISIVGFYPTYIIHFPAFRGFTWIHHFHGFIASTWITMLIAQAFLIRAKKVNLHRKIGKLTYLVMPLLLFSFFLMSRATYFKNIHINHLSQPDALAEMSKSGLPDVFYMGVIYSLGILFKHKTSWHLRFFTCTGFMILGPGLGRLVFMNLSPPLAGLIMGLTIIGIPLVWLIADLVMKKSPIPLLIFLGISVIAINLNNFGHSRWWQAIAGWIASHLFLI